MNPSERVDNRELITNSRHVHMGPRGDEASVTRARGKHNTTLLLIYELTLKVCGPACRFVQLKGATAFICSDVLSGKGD